MCEEESPVKVGAPPSYGTIAKMIWDGEGMVIIPDEMGNPSKMQLLGSKMEMVSELACRVCYDSLGKGRGSSELHQHVLEVGHLSVYEHTHMTIKITAKDNHKLPLAALLNRPGIWVRFAADMRELFLTINPRVLLDWEKFTAYPDGNTPVIMRGVLAKVMKPHCKAILGDVPEYDADSWTAERVEPAIDEEKWITMFVAGSRGFSHELVRHGDFTAISQRSTRYVDEDGSPWVDHPLVQEYLANEDLPVTSAEHLKEPIEIAKTTAREAYALVAKTLQSWLVDKGVDKFTARKQARGAARGYLGNALYTEVVFSASVAQWKRMLRMRCCAPADAEIRAVFAQALAELKGSRYGESFSGFTLEPSPDGIGMIAVEKDNN